jgi:hypothetical protein
MDERIRTDAETLSVPGPAIVTKDQEQPFGPALACCEADKPLICVALGVFGVFCAFGCLAIFAGIMTYVHAAPTTQNPLGALIAFTGMGVIILLRSAYRIRVAVKALSSEILVYADGIVCRACGQTVVCRWDRIDAVYCYTSESSWVTIYHLLSTVCGERKVYTITTVDKSKIAINSYFRGFKSLEKIIRRETSERLLPRMRQACESGNACDFGALSLDSLGITKRRWLVKWWTFLRWDQLWMIEYTENKLLVWQKGRGVPWCRVRAHKVPNLHVLELLYREFMEKRL